MERKPNRYAQILERIFQKYYQEGIESIKFKREEFEEIAAQLEIKLPKNQGDLVYFFRYRSDLPKSIVDKAKEGHEWVILPAGRGMYNLSQITRANFIPNENMANTKIPDATPGIISKYALSDEQALLAKIRYNRLIDIFTGVTCYSLQNHLRTSLEEMGQVETDEVYVGIDKQGVHYVFPVQAKGGKDRIGVVQILQDFAMCAEKFPSAIGRPIAAQFMNDDTIVLFEFVQRAEGIRILTEKHYRLVPPDDLSDDELLDYRRSS